MSDNNQEPALAKDAVLQLSEEMPQDTPKVKGYDFNSGIHYEELLESYLFSGFQATNFGLAVEEINKMVRFIIVSNAYSNIMIIFSFQQDQFH